MPALRVFEDVFGEEDTVTAPVARVMWQLGRRCPALRLGTASTTEIGWGLAELARREAAGASRAPAGRAVELRPSARAPGLALIDG